MTPYSARMIEERRQEGGCNGIGGRVRKVQVAWTVQGKRLVRQFGEHQGGLPAAEAWAAKLNEQYGIKA